MNARPTALITGGSGGMGRACARLFGASHDLVLTDASPALADFASELRADGYRIRASVSCDLGDPSMLRDLAATVPDGAPLKLIHTAGLSPSQADWRSILAVNVVATHRLLDAIEARLAAGSVGVLIASSAGHMQLHVPGVDAVLAEPLVADFDKRMAAFVEPVEARSDYAASGFAYSLSKRAVIDLVQRRARRWGERGSRIVSISPGFIQTPMGLSELEGAPGAGALRDAAPVARAGVAMDIAQAAWFLANEAASFISGTDLLVDGGSVAAMAGQMERQG